MCVTYADQTDTRLIATIGSELLRHGALALHALKRYASLEARVTIPAFAHSLLSSLLEISRRQFVASVTARFSGRSSQTNCPRELGITERAIKAHRQRIFDELRAQTIGDLILLAERLGILLN